MQKLLFVVTVTLILLAAPNVRAGLVTHDLSADYGLMTRIAKPFTRKGSDRPSFLERKGRNRIASQDDKERQAFAQLSFPVATTSKGTEIKGGIVTNPQRTVGGTTNYSGLGLVGAAQFSF